MWAVWIPSIHPSIHPLIEHLGAPIQYRARLGGGGLCPGCFREPQKDCEQGRSTVSSGGL